MGPALSVEARSDALHQRVRRFIAETMVGPSSEEFDALALDLARFQADSIPSVARLGRARGVDLGAASAAAAIPAVPCDAFRLTRIAAHPPDADVRVFRTSGTSQGALARGEHALRTLDTYAAGALAWGRALLFPEIKHMRAIILAPAPAEAGDSSLGYMLELFAEELGGEASWHVKDGAVDLEGIAAACARAREQEAAAIVLGTSFAYVHMLDALGAEDLSLPPGSRVMQTGGFKGRSREVSAPELRRAIAQRFAMTEVSVVAEYGMTELSSQLYEGTLVEGAGAAHGVYLAPPWVRVSAVDPLTLEPLPRGEAGIARIVDLANVDSAVAIQTADRVVVSDGRGRESARVELLGRAPGAAPRGCSIAIDELLAPGAS